MSKPSQPAQTILFCGIDVSAATLEVAVQQEDRPFERREFANSSRGHKALIAWLTRRRQPVRVSLEATGIYSLDLALALDRADGIELAVLNLRRANRFAQTLGRSKTDAADAQALAQYSRRMEFVPWHAPSPAALQLRALSRHLAALTVEHTRAGNRLHAAQGSTATPRCVVDDLKRALASLHKRILKLRREAMTLVQSDNTLRQRFDLLTSIPGIAQISALHLLGELALLTLGMSVRQWVAHSGLDPTHRLSEPPSTHPPASAAPETAISAAPSTCPPWSPSAMTPTSRPFYTALLDRHKAKLQALIAVARKLLHAIFGIFKSKTPYNGNKLFPQIQPLPS